jgi:hypothetical protein
MAMQVNGNSGSSTYAPGGIGNVNGLTPASVVETTQTPSSPPNSVDAGVVAIDGRQLLVDPNTAPGGWVGEPGKVDGTGFYDRGTLEIAEAIPTAEGMKVTVHVGHAMPDDTVELVLQARLRDGGQQKIINLGVVAAGLQNGGAPDSVLTFEVRYADIDAYLKEINPNLAFRPGAPLAVLAQWKGYSGYFLHSWGGFNRDGVFYTEGPAETVTATDGTIVSRDPPPLDIGVRYGEILWKKHPALAYRGQLSSRLEYETKWKVPDARFQSMLQEIETAVADPAKVRELFGADWVLEPVKKYWKTDPKTGEKVLEPMVDTYYDVDQLTLTEKEYVARFRSKEKDTKNIFGIKLPGETDAAGINTRVDYGLQVKTWVKNDPKVLGPFLRDMKEPLNPMRFLQAELPGVDLGELKPVLRLIDKRHKYNLTNKKTQMQIELSLDDVRAISLIHKDGQGNPLTSSYKQIEFEVNHLQMGSTNVVNGNKGVRTALIEDAQKQEAFIRNASDKATFGGAPRIHQPSDVKHPSLAGNPTFLEHQKLTELLKGWFFPNSKPVPAHQKANEGFRRMGVIK